MKPRRLDNKRIRKPHEHKSTLQSFDERLATEERRLPRTETKLRPSLTVKICRKRSVQKENTRKRGSMKASTKKVRKDKSKSRSKSKQKSKVKVCSFLQEFNNQFLEALVFSNRSSELVNSTCRRPSLPNPPDQRIQDQDLELVVSTDEDFWRRQQAALKIQRSWRKVRNRSIIKQYNRIFQSRKLQQLQQETPPSHVIELSPGKAPWHSQEQFPQIEFQECECIALESEQSIDNSKGIPKELLNQISKNMQRSNMDIFLQQSQIEPPDQKTNVKMDFEIRRDHDPEPIIDAVLDRLVEEVLLEMPSITPEIYFLKNPVIEAFRTDNDLICQFLIHLAQQIQSVSKPVLNQKLFEVIESCFNEQGRTNSLLRRAFHRCIFEAFREEWQYFQHCTEVTDRAYQVIQSLRIRFSRAKFLPLFEKEQFLQRESKVLQRQMRQFNKLMELEWRFDLNDLQFVKESVAEVLIDELILEMLNGRY